MLDSSRLPRLLPLVVVMASRTALAGGGGVSSGSFTVSFIADNTQFANLSPHDCTHSQPFDFQFAFPWSSGQEAEYFLSLSSDCESPNSATFPGATSCSATTPADCPSMLLQNSMTLSEPADLLTTDYGAANATAPTLTSGGIWGFFTEQSQNMSPSATYTTDLSANTTMCGPPNVVVDDTLVYICVLINTGDATITTSVPFGALSIALDSTPPEVPSQPVVTPLDSGLRVSWDAVTDATYYRVLVVEAGTSTADGGVQPWDTDAGADDGGVATEPDAGTIVASALVLDQTTTVVHGLQNGVRYNVFVQALDDAGTNPPTTSNVGGLSQPGSGTPVASPLQKQSESVKSGCSSTELPGFLALLPVLVRMRRRHQVFAGR